MDEGGRTLSHKRTQEPGTVTYPVLFRILECDRPLVPPACHRLDRYDRIFFGRDDEHGIEEMSVEGARGLAVRIPDPWMSASHAELTRSMGGWVLEDKRSKNGTLLNGLLTDRAELKDGDVFELGHTFFSYRQSPPPEETEGAPLPGFSTVLPELTRRLLELAKVARSNISVLITGESGTGKEVAARAIHARSERKGPFVAVNCGALPAALVESELFGHRKGAFTGATEDRPGLVRSAHGGTLFLDEIGDLPAPSQAALLRVLQEREVTPVGGERPIPVDFRLVAATHRDLAEAVTRGSFRGDLKARLSGFELKLPPLRDRKEDLGLLLGTLLGRLAPGRGAGLTPEAARSILCYDWPFNVRELEKCLETSLVLAGSGPIEVWHLPESVRLGPGQRPATPERSSRPVSSRPLTEDDNRRKAELVALLREHHGNISAVARAMGKARMQIQRWVKRFGLTPEDYR